VTSDVWTTLDTIVPYTFYASCQKSGGVMGAYLGYSSSAAATEAGFADVESTTGVLSGPLTVGSTPQPLSAVSVESDNATTQTGYGNVEFLGGSGDVDFISNVSANYTNSTCSVSVTLIPLS
jgi:hypothetical protein